MADEHMLSTSDNPWNPWTDYEAWLAYDMREGHNTLSLLDRVTYSSSEISEADQVLAVEQGIADIIRLHSGGIYVAVPKPS